MGRTGITVFRLLDTIEGKPMSAENAIKDDAPVTWYNPVEDSNLSGATLAVKDESAHPAKWQTWVGAEFDVPEMSVNLPGAALLLKVPKGKKVLWFAVCFGSGHQLIEPAAVWRDWGLRTAINILDRLTGAEELKRVDSKNVIGTRMFTAQQAARRDTIDRFGVDIRRDLLSAVAGAPESPAEWGTMIEGKDGIHVAIEKQLVDIADVCAALQRHYERKDYQKRFSWIDHIVPVREPGLRSRLMNQLIADLKNKAVGSYELSPPELVSWDRTFRYVGVGKVEVADLKLSDYVGFLQVSTTQTGSSNKLLDLDESMLRHHRVEIMNGDSIEASWPLLRCLEGEIVAGNATYLMFNGDFYQVSSNYIDEVNSYLKTIATDRAWPTKTLGLEEAEYIESVATSSMTSIVMDQKNVRARTMTSVVEVCDLYEAGLRLVHLKRKTRSSTLSHLMNQALVSSQLIVRDDEFRRAAVDMVLSQETAKKSKFGAAFTKFAGRELNPAKFVASNYTVVIGVLSAWDPFKDWHEQLPFFSRVTLRNLHEELRAMGFEVVFAAIQSPDD